MMRSTIFRRVLLVAVAAVLVQSAPALPQAKFQAAPRPEPFAETKVLMQGINVPYFTGLDRLLRRQPASDDKWGMVRGQAQLIAENGNLLLLRPARSQGQETWLERAADLRAKAIALDEAAAKSDFARSRAALTALAGACNRCHESFKVSVRVQAFAERTFTTPTGLALSPRQPPEPPSPAPVPQVPAVPPVPEPPLPP
jgi:hypothetical protein